MAARTVYGQPIVEAGAEFSSCGVYRYLLWRRWSDEPSVTFIMLNPSTADADVNDPTVARCERRAHRMGYGGVQVVNLFALRSTDPAALYEAREPSGGQANNSAICQAAATSKTVIAAWGRHGRYNHRDRDVLSLLDVRHVEVYCLGTNADGTPKHPLYLRNSAPIVLFRLPSQYVDIDG